MIYALSIWRLVDFYTRSALGEGSAMAFLPFIALGFWFIFSEDNRAHRSEGILNLAFGFAGMIQVHVLSVIMAGIFSVLLCLIYINKLFRNGRFLDIVLSAGLCLALSAGVLVPLADYYMTQPMRISGDTPLIQGNGIYLPQLLSTYFYPNQSSEAFNSASRMAHEMPLTIGLALILSLFGAVYFWFTGRLKDVRHTTIKVAALAFLSLVMTLTVFPYDWLADRLPFIYKIIGSIQFPFRFLIISAILAAVVFVLWRTELKGDKSLEVRLAVMLILAMCVWQSLDYMSKYINTSDYHIIANDDKELDTFTYDINEYLLCDTSADFVKHNEAVEPGEGVELLKEERGDLSYHIELKNALSETAYLEIPVFAYKGFIAKAKNDILNISYGQSDRIRIDIPANYEGEVDVYFQEPAYWRVAELLSLLSWLGCLTWVIYLGVYIKHGES